MVSSLVSKETSVEWADYELRHRYWAVVTTDPGSGKSPSLNVILECFARVCAKEEIAQLLPGCRETNFHIVTTSTHAAFNARLNETGGYALLASPEATTSLCPDYPRSGKFAKESYVALNRLLETAHGGSYHWDTQADVLGRKKLARKEEAADGKQDNGVHFDSTNVGCLYFQQPCVLQTWWAQAEARFKVGLANRFVFSSSRRVTQVMLPEGLRRKMELVLEELFACIIRHHGPYARSGGAARRWRFPAQSES
jgi:hypothetical protein